ncbi:MAG: ABC transporter permease [Candidatus Eisenbacteria bacterium]
MNLSDLLRQSVKAITNHKRRNFFSTFGIAWGVASVLILAGWGVGLQKFMKEGMGALGEDLIIVFPGHTSTGIGGYRAGRPIPLYPEDIDVIKAYASKLKTVIPIDEYNLTVSRGAKSEDRDVRAVVPDARIMRKLQPERGRFFTPDDMRDRRRVCYLGRKTAAEYFKAGEDPLGQELRISGIRFTIVGILPEKKQMAQIGTRDEDLVFIPFSTGRSLFGGRHPLWCIMGQSFNPEQDEEAVKEIRRAMAAKYHFAPEDEEALFILPMTKYTKMMDKFSAAIAIFVAGVGALTLAIGGIGVMNMMLVSVNERIGEIGIRRAVGATRKWIVLQFLTESFLLTVVAGVIGLAVGLIILLVGSRLPVPEYIPLPILSVNVTIVAITVMVATGIASGITPARRAAGIPPVQAIKGNLRTLMPKMKRTRTVLPFPGLFGEIVSQALDDIRTSRLRAVLTGFGVFWGVAAVALLMGWGIGMQERMEEDIAQLGGRRTVIYPRRVESKISGLKRASQLRFTQEDIDDITTNAWYIEYFTPELWAGFPVVEYGGESRAVHTLGVMPDVKIVRNFGIAKGRFINLRDIREVRKVCVLGASVKERLFGSEEAVGKLVRIKGKAFTVAGVMTAKGEQNSINTSLDDDKLLIPYSTAKVLTGSRYPSYLMLHPTTAIPYDDIEERLRGTILANHGIDQEDAVGIYSALEAQREIGKVMIGLTAFLGGVGLVTLLIGGVGVANVMFVSVAQRTREIGIRRAAGARKIHVFLQFLSEAVIICLAGGVLGALLALGISKGLSVLPLPRMFAAPKVNGTMLLLIFGFIVGAGIISGIFPARKASNSNVIDSLRYE